MALWGSHVSVESARLMWGVSVERGNAAEGEVAASRETEVSVPLPTEWTAEGNRTVSTRGGEGRRGEEARSEM